MPGLIDDDCETPFAAQTPQRPAYVSPRPKANTAPPSRAGPAQSRSGRETGSQSRDVADDDPSVYLISVCDGIGGAMLAVSQYTQRIAGCAVEKEPNLRQFVAQKWPQMHCTAMIEDVDVSALLRQVRHMKPDIVLMIGGVPCQSFSALADEPLGFPDERTAPIRHFVRIRDAM